MRMLEEITAHLSRSPSDLGSTIMTMPSLRPLRPRDAEKSPGETPHFPSKVVKKSPFKIRLANMCGIRDQASMLIQERYVQRGYGTQELTEDPNRLTIVAYDGKQPVGTLSIRFDSSEGLLCDDLYRDEVDALRGEGRNVCEFIKLAVNASTSSIKTLVALFHVAFIHAHRLHGFDDVVIEVNPHHVKFYERSLGFRQIGPERVNQRVHAPAILLRCEFSYIGEQVRKFGGKPELSKAEKSFYSHGFSEREEQDIQRRLEMVGNALRTHGR